jgi:hypothetical protein
MSDAQTKVLPSQELYRGLQNQIQANQKAYL